MVFSTDSEVSDQYESSKKDKYHGTFGLGCLTPTACCEMQCSNLLISENNTFLRIVDVPCWKQDNAAETERFG